jgi:calcium-dependent protein kinase
MGCASSTTLEEKNKTKDGLVSRVCGMYETKEFLTVFKIDREATLGIGRNGAVILCRHIGSNYNFALKNTRKFQNFRELKLLRALDHPNVVRPYFQVGHNGVLYEKLNGGELFDRCLKYGVAHEGTARQYISSIVYAVKYCHTKNIIHGDIKLENIMFEEESLNAELKLIDFDTAELFRGERLNNIKGTALYMAPEVFEENCEYSIFEFFILFICLIYHANR